MWQIIGQERAVTLLSNGLEAGNPAHAYLLVGPEHVGKMTLAVNLAQALNCESAERPCLECASCRKIAALGHADVQVVGLSRNGDNGEAKLISTEQIKDILHAASLPPYEGKHKVFIIDQAELMSIEAANRLLKTLEEPEEKVAFILLTINDRLLPETVVSRCQRLELPPLSTEAVAAALEGRGIETGRARLLAGFSHGCAGWALSAAEDEGLVRQHDEQMDRLIGVINGDFEERFTYSGQLAARFGQDRGEVYAVLDLWLDYWRDLMLVKLGREELITNTDRKETLADMARRYSLAAVRKFIDSIRAAAENLRKNVNPRLALEVLVLDIPKEGAKDPASRA